MDTHQQQHVHALPQREKTLISHQYEQARMKSWTGQTARLQEQTHGRQLSSEEESAHAQYLLRQAIQKHQSTQQIMAARQLTSEQDSLAIQQSVRRQTPMREERMPPTESMIFPKSTTLHTLIPEDQMPLLESIPPPSNQPAAPTGFPIPGSLSPTLGRRVSGAFKSTAPWGRNWSVKWESYRLFIPPDATSSASANQPCEFRAGARRRCFIAKPHVVIFRPSRGQRMPSIRAFHVSTLETRSPPMGGIAPYSYYVAIVGEIIPVLPKPFKLAGLSCMGQTGNAVETRTIQALVYLLDARYGKTDSERSRPWLNQFAEFAREPAGNLKDFRARALRTATRLDTLGVKMSAGMMFPNALHALKLSVP